MWRTPSTTKVVNVARALGDPIGGEPAGLCFQEIGGRFGLDVGLWSVALRERAGGKKGEDQGQEGERARSHGTPF